MNRSSDSFTDVIEAWLDSAPAEEDVESVLAGIVAEVDDTPQQRLARGWWAHLDSSVVVGFGLGAAATILIALIGAQFIGRTGQGGGLTPSEPAATPTNSPAATGSSAPTDCPFPGRAGSRVGLTPTADMRGLIGLPDEGATLSAPEQGQLVDCWPVRGGHLPYQGMVRLYADGRLIWNYYYPPLLSGTTGHIEQRLTPDGVALVTAMDDIGLRDPLRLGEWLPASAWEDQTMRPYVPSGYGACLSIRDGEGHNPDRTLSVKLAMLPTQVTDRLSSKPLVSDTEEVAYDETFHCLGLDLDEARVLDGELRRLGFAQDEQTNRFLLAYHMNVDGTDRDGPGTTVIRIWFEPIFPDGSIGCSACG